MDHIRIDPRIDEDPDLLDAGWTGARVFEFLIKLIGRHDLRGRIPVSRQRREWLARQWNLEAGDLGEALELELDRAAVARLLDFGIRRLLEVSKAIAERGDGTPFLVVEEDGAWLLPGWERFYPSKRGGQTSTHRTRKHRGLDPETGERAGTAGTHGNGAEQQEREERREPTQHTTSHHDHDHEKDLPAPDGASPPPAATPTPEPDPAPKPPTPRKPSLQEKAYAWAMEERGKVCDLSDTPLPVVKLRAMLGPVLDELGTPLFKASYRAFLADDYARTKLDPPFAMGFFVSQFRRYRAKARELGLEVGPPAPGAQPPAPPQPVLPDVDPYRS